MTRAVAIKRAGSSMLVKPTSEAGCYTAAGTLPGFLKGQFMKYKPASPILLLALVTMCSAPVLAADTDGRQFVEMPPEARTALRAEMLDFQTALHSIISALAERKFTVAADIAEKQMGISAMGRHRNAPPNARPGMFMPNDMHSIARSMHAASSEFAKVAGSGDTTKALGALQAVTAACVACHSSFRAQ